jgi:hypothetical protein
MKSSGNVAVSAQIRMLKYEIKIPKDQIKVHQASKAVTASPVSQPSLAAVSPTRVATGSQPSKRRRDLPREEEPSETGRRPPKKMCGKKLSDEDKSKLKI